jgi:DNA polymerase-3 subunit gamma/tau
VLLTFNEILSHGFDGHNFVNGLSSHFRDLLVCKDEVTLPLLEVSPTVKEKYKVQSKFCPAPFLLTGLEILNKTDSQYKSSRNQRLLVEMTLLKLCGIQNGSAVETKPAEAVKKKN